MEALLSMKAGGITSDGGRRTENELDFRSPQRDVHSWTALILQQAKCGQGRRALKMYEKMLKERVEPSPRTFVALLKACSSLQDLESAKKIHADVVRRGFDSDLYVCTMLVDAYAKCRSLVDARNAFDRMPRRDVVSWNAMIFGYAQLDEGEEALELYIRMKQEGVVPRDRTYVGALKACCTMAESGTGDGIALKDRCLKAVKAIHTDIANGKLEMGVFLGTMLVNAYAKCQSVDDARQLFEKMPFRDVVSWNAMILGYAQMDNGEEALHLYTRMLQEGVLPDDRTYVSALKACSALAATANKNDGTPVRTRCLETVRAIHARVRKANFESDLFVGNMLVDAYAKCGSLDDASLVFESMHFRDVVSWNATISGYAQVGNGEQALQLYTRMQQEGVVPDDRTYVGVLKACSTMAELGEKILGDGIAVKERCLEIVRAIHTEIVKVKVEPDVFVGNMLMDVYAKCGNLENAWRVFENMPLRTVVSWNTMMLGYAQMGRGEEALNLYVRLQQEGVVPDDRIYVSALKACSTMAESREKNAYECRAVKERCLQTVRAIHADAVNGKCELGVFVGTMLVNAYAKCGSLEDAREMFENMPSHDVISWNAIILGYAQVGTGEEALQLYRRMQSEGVVPDDRTYVSALKACSTAAESGERNEADRRAVKEVCLKTVRAIHTDVVKGKFEVGVFVGTTLVDAYAKCGSLEDARLVFEKMPDRTVVSWNAMILGYAQIDKGQEALQLYTQMQQEGVVPDGHTYGGALKACTIIAELRERDEGEEGTAVIERCLETVIAIHKCVKQRNLEMDLFLGNILVDAYAKCGSLEDARRVFEKMPCHDVVSWNTMIFAYLQMDKGEDALQVYTCMQQEGVVPNKLTYVAALSACGSVAGLEKGKEIHAQIFEAGLEDIDSLVAGSLIAMYGRCGSMVDAQEVFDTLPKRDVEAWNALIAGYAQQGDSELVFGLFSRMEQKGVQPDAVTFLGVLTVCTHVGLVNTGQMYFKAMTDEYGITPTIKHFTCVIDLLGRSGQLDKAMELVKVMPFQPDSVVWVCVLGACQKWRDVEIGRHAFECTVRLNKDLAAAYVLMSNIYSAARMRDEATKIQDMRVKSQAWKQPGQSWCMDMRGSVQFFVVGDLGHPERQDTYAQLGDLLVKMKTEEYLLPHIDSVRTREGCLPEGARSVWSQ